MYNVYRDVVNFWCVSFAISLLFEETYEEDSQSAEKVW